MQFKEQEVIIKNNALIEFENLVKLFCHSFDKLEKDLKIKQSLNSLNFTYPNPMHIKAMIEEEPYRCKLDKNDFPCLFEHICKSDFIHPFLFRNLTENYYNHAKYALHCDSAEIEIQKSIGNVFQKLMELFFFTYFFIYAPQNHHHYQFKFSFLDSQGSVQYQKKSICFYVNYCEKTHQSIFVAFSNGDSSFSFNKPFVKRSLDKANHFLFDCMNITDVIIMNLTDKSNNKD